MESTSFFLVTMSLPGEPIGMGQFRIAYYRGFETVRADSGEDVDADAFARYLVWEYRLPTGSYYIAETSPKPLWSRSIPNWEVPSPEKLFTGSWRTFQMSDHLPLRVELKIDFSDQYLKKQKKTK